uniref:Cytochrome b5 heme-binding domain-containing protein n=1 Tax=Araucaria cunninghamii TaxID=56994 RepID=A0A0D6R4V0_ARACU
MCEFPSEEKQHRPMARKISKEELRKHNRREDLWLAVEGKVYDVTAWVDKHPGGELPLLNLAGQDISDIFVAYHPPEAWKYLAVYFIGRLEEGEEDLPAMTRDYRMLREELHRAGMFRGSLDMYYRIVLSIFAMLSLVVYGVAYSGSVWARMLSAVFLGLAWMQSSFIGHDSAHSGLLPNKKLEVAIQLLVGNMFTGISIGWWKRSHNVHHTSVNNLEYDPDLQYVPLYAVSSRFFQGLYSKYYEKPMNFDWLARFLVSYQHWTFYPVMAVARVLLYMHSFTLVFSPKKKVQYRRLEIAALGVFWLWFPFLISCVPTWTERVAFVLVCFAVSGIQHVQFCLNHFSSSVFVGRPRSENWFPEQIAGTLDITCSPWMDWFHGGLQFQVEHHCFPRVPRTNLRKLRDYVKPLCEKHGLPYRSATFWEANVMMIHTLRTAAMEARDLSKPVPTCLLWEAVNTHG